MRVFVRQQFYSTVNITKKLESKKRFTVIFYINYQYMVYGNIMYHHQQY